MSPLDPASSETKHEFNAARQFAQRKTLVARVEGAFWVTGILLAIVHNAVELQHELIEQQQLRNLISSVTLQDVLLNSLFAWPNGFLALLLIFVVLTMLTFEAPPFTLLVQFLLTPARPRLAQEPSPSASERPVKIEEPDKVGEKSADEHLEEFLERSRAVAHTASTRPQVLMFVGALIALGGLVFFVITLPRESSVSFGSGTAEISTRVLGLSLEMRGASTVTPEVLDHLTPEERATLFRQKPLSERFLNDVLPRLLMLLFIQVLAGFFLRQYRAGIEDFRYYEAIVRRRETEALVYSLQNTHPNDPHMKSFADQLLADVPDFGILKKGQTSLVMEAAKASENEFQTLVEKVLAKIDLQNLLRKKAE